MPDQRLENRECAIAAPQMDQHTHKTEVVFARGSQESTPECRQSTPCLGRPAAPSARHFAVRHFAAGDGVISYPFPSETIKLLRFHYHFISQAVNQAKPREKVRKMNPTYLAAQLRIGTYRAISVGGAHTGATGTRDV